MKPSHRKLHIASGINLPAATPRLYMYRVARDVDLRQSIPKAALMS